MTPDQLYLTYCYHVDLPGIQRSLNEGIDVNYQNGHCLVAVISGHGSLKEKEVTLEYLLQAGGKLLNSRETLLTWAVKEREPELVKFFLKKGIKPNDDDGTAVFTAMKNQDQSILSYLFSNGAVINQDVKEYFEITETPIQACVEYFSYFQSIILMSFERGSNVALELEQNAIMYTHQHFHNCSMLPGNISHPWY